MAEIPEDILQNSFGTQDRADLFKQAAEFTPQPEPQQPPIEERFKTWDDYKTDPSFGELDQGQKQELFDQWKQYSIGHLSKVGALSTEDDAKTADSFFNEIADTEKLQKTRGEAPNYVGQLIEQGQSGLNSMQSGVVGYGAAIGAADPVKASELIAANNLKTQNRYVSPPMQKYGEENKGFFETARKIISNPIDIMLPMFAQSIGSNLPAMGASLVAGGAVSSVATPAAGVIAGLGTSAVLGGITDTLVSFDQLVGQEVQKRGLSPLDPKAIQSVLEDPEFQKQAVAYTSARGAVITATELGALGLGKLIAAPAEVIAKAGARGLATEFIKQAPVQVVAEGIGEAAAQVAGQKATGQEIKVSTKDVAEEMFAGLPMAGLESAGIAYHSLVVNDAPLTADETLRQKVEDYTVGKYEKILGQEVVDGTIPPVIQPPVLGEVPTPTAQPPVLEKPTPTAQPPILEETITPAPVVEAPAPVAEVPVVAPTPEALVPAVTTEAPASIATPTEPLPVTPAAKATLAKSAPATLQVVESGEAKVPTPVPTPEVPAPIVPKPEVEAPVAVSATAPQAVTPPATPTVPVAEAPALAPVPETPEANFAETDSETLALLNDLSPVEFPKLLEDFLKYGETYDAVDFWIYGFGSQDDDWFPAIKQEAEKVLDAYSAYESELLKNPAYRIPKTSGFLNEAGMRKMYEKFPRVLEHLLIDFLATRAKNNRAAEENYRLIRERLKENPQKFLEQREALPAPKEVPALGFTPPKTTPTLGLPAPTPVTQKLPPTKKQVTALSKLGYLPADIEALDRVQTKNILSNQIPKVPIEKAQKETEAVVPPQVQPTDGEVSQPVAPATDDSTTQVPVQDRLDKAKTDLEEVVKRLGAELGELGLDAESVSQYFGGTLSPQNELQLRALLNILNHALATAQQTLKVAEGRGRTDLKKTFTNLKNVKLRREGYGGGVYANPRDVFNLDTLYVDPDQLLRSFASKGVSDPASFFVKALSEEILHANHGLAMYQAFLGTSPTERTQEAFQTFYDAQNKEIENSLSIDQMKEIVGKYAQALGVTFEGKTKEQVIAEFNKGRPGRLAEEYLRGLIQQRLTGSITEDTLKAFSTRPILRSLGALRNYFAKLIGLGTKRESRKTYVDKYYDSIVSLLVNSSPAELRAASEEQGTVIPGSQLASSIDPNAMLQAQETSASKKALYDEIARELGPRDKETNEGGLWRRSVIGALKKSFRTTDPSEVESLVYASIPEAVETFNGELGNKFSTYLFRIAKQKILEEKEKVVKQRSVEVSLQAPGFVNTSAENLQAEKEAEAIEKAKEDLTLGEVEDKVAPEAAPKNLEEEIKKIDEKIDKAIEKESAKEIGTLPSNIAEDEQEIEEVTIANGEQISSLDAEIANKRTARMEAELGEAGKLLADAAKNLGLTKMEVDILQFTADPKASLLTRAELSDKYGLNNIDFDDIRDDVIRKMREQLVAGGVTKTADVLASSIDPNLLEARKNVVKGLFGNGQFKTILQNIVKDEKNQDYSTVRVAKFILDTPQLSWIYDQGPTTIVVTGDEKLNKKRSGFIGLTLGNFNPKTREIGINPDLLEYASEEITDTQIKKQLSRTFVHELIHKISTIPLNVINNLEAEYEDFLKANPKARKTLSSLGDFVEKHKDFIVEEQGELENILNTEGLTAEKINELLLIKRRFESFLEISILKAGEMGYSRRQARATIYGLANIDELIAEGFSNIEFQKFLSTIPDPVAGVKRSLFDTFLSLVKDILSWVSSLRRRDNRTTKNNLLGSVMFNLGELIKLNPQDYILNDVAGRVKTKPVEQKYPYLASSIDPNYTQALSRALRTMPEDVVKALTERTYIPYEDEDLIAKANKFVDENSPGGDVMHAKRILDGVQNMPFQDRVVALGVIGKRLRNALYAHVARMEAKGTTPEGIALRNYLSNNLTEVLSRAQDLGTRAGQDLRSMRTLASMFLPYEMAKLYTGPISDQQKSALAHKEEVLNLLAEIEKLKGTIAGLAVEEAVGKLPKLPIFNGGYTPLADDNFFKLLSAFGDLAPLDSETFETYLQRIGIPYDELMATLEDSRAAAVGPEGVATVDFKKLSASEAIEKLLAKDKNLFSKLVGLRLKTNRGSDTTAVQENFTKRKADAPALKQRNQALQLVFDFFNTTQSEKPSSQEAVEVAKDNLPPLVRLAKYAADSIAEKVIRSLGVTKESMPKGSFEKLEAQVRKMVNAQFKQELDPKKAATEDTRPAEQRLLDMVQRIKLAEQVFNEVQANLQGQLTEDNRIIDAGAEGRLSSEERKNLEALVSRKFDLDKVAGLDSALKQIIDFKVEARKHMTQRGASLESITALIKEKLPQLDEQQVNDLASQLVKRYDAILKKDGARQLENIVKRVGERASRDPKSTLQQLMELINLGAFDQEKFYNAIADRFNLPTWDPAVVEKIKGIADQMERMPEGSDQRATKGVELQALIAEELQKQEKGWDAVGRKLDVAAALWKAGVLSGPPTQLVNLGATHLNVLFELLTEARAYYKASKATGKKATFGEFFNDALSAYVQAVGKMGVAEASDAFATGLSRFRNETQTQLSPLELIKFDQTKPWNYKNYLAAWKIVGRAMAAADTYNSVIANEAKFRMAARYSMMKDGLTSDQATKKMNELFDANSPGMKAIEDQVNKEETAGQFGTLVALTPGTSDYRGQNRKITAGRNRRLSQLREQYIASESKISNDGVAKIRQFTQKATFNNQPTGMIGYLGEAVIGQIAGKTKLLTPFAAFPRTIANIINSSLDYTPYGWARANGFSLGNLSPFIRNSTYAFEKPEKGSIEYHQLQAKAFFGSLITFSIIGMAMKDMDKDWDESFFAVTGRGPTDANKREQLRQSGWTENSVKIGPLRFKHTDFPGLNLVFGSLALVSDQWRYGKLSEKDFGTVAATAALSVGNTIIDKNLLSGAKVLFDAVSDGGDPGDKAKRLLQSYTGGFSNPGMARWLTRTFNIGADGKVGVTDFKELNSTTGGWLVGQTPLAVIFGKPMLNRLGEEVRDYPWAATVKRFGFLPEVKPHPVFSPLIKADLFVPGISIGAKIKAFERGKPVARKMTREEYYDYSKYDGEFLRRILTPAMAQALAREATINPDSAQKKLEDLAQRAKDYARIRIETQIRSKKK